MTTFKRLNRFRYNNGSGLVTIATDASQPVRIQQSLEGAVTMVGEVALADYPDDLTENTPVRIDQIDLYQIVTTAPVHRQLTGQVNVIRGESSPQQAGITATGPLSKLRRSPQDDHDLTGMTDQEAVSYILDICNVSFDDSNIGGWSYELGQRSDVIWTAGTRGSEMISELDSVFSCATIELGDGTVVRFPYRLSPYRYPDPVLYAATFRKGSAGAQFYGNSRTRGDLDRIVNSWEVKGFSWQGEEGAADEGVRYQIFAQAYGENDLLGTNVYVRQTFSSDLIQTEDLAKAIAIRLIQDTNRSPDIERVDTGNNHDIIVGTLVLVKDNTPGINLDSDKRYLVTGTNREGDFMSADLVGGATGTYDVALSGILKETPSGTTDVGNNPDPFDPGDPTIPGGGIPDLEIPDFPDGGEITEPPDPSQPFTGCETEGAGWSIGDVEPPPGSVDYWIPWRGIDANWLKVASEDTDPAFPLITLLDHLDGKANDDTWYYNTTDGTKTGANDHQFGTNELVSVSGCFKFHYPESNFEVALRGDTGIAFMGVTFYAESGGLTLEPLGPDLGGHYGIAAHSENQGSGRPGIAINEGSGNNGGLAAGPFPVGEEITFSIAFDPSPEYQTIAVSTSAGGTYFRDRTHQGTGPLSELHYDDCEHSYHYLELSYNTSGVTDPSDFDHPRFTLCGLSLGLGTCAANPDYEPIAQDPGDPLGDE